MGSFGNTLGILNPKNALKMADPRKAIEMTKDVFSDPGEAIKNSVQGMNSPGDAMGMVKNPKKGLNNTMGKGNPYGDFLGD